MFWEINVTHNVTFREWDFVGQNVKIEREINVVIFLGGCDLRPDAVGEKDFVDYGLACKGFAGTNAFFHFPFVFRR